ncbi:hypothetical protein KGQ90_08225 [Modicisalibacter tunisiensis]|uniref:hypothetical protein n=1 Tax=Modicisalibacter tunisiensis TaxID=390637 RepID=UPI001CCAF9E4|nr:hypothetical protein [Modicisalibacter tunisiensis]MBZ9538923.1 hypothetical protein [Modicisalibacter tunisiensis]
MIRRLLFLVALVPVLFLVSTSAQAEWGQRTSFDSGKCDPSNGGCSAELTALRAEGRSRISTYLSTYENGVYTFSCGLESVWGSSLMSTICRIYGDNNGQLPAELPDTPLYGHVYTDDQCQAQYGHATVLKGELESPPYSTGACSLTPAPGTVGVCSFYDSAGNHAPDGQCYVTGDFTATSTGEVNDPSTGSNVDPDGQLSDAFTETTDPSTCSGGYVGSGGSYYCYSGDAADINVGAFDSAGNPITLDDQGAYDANGDPITVTDGAYDASGNPIEVGGGLSIGGGSWGDAGSGTDSGTGTDTGTGTDSGTGTDTGTDLSGVLDAISGVKASIQDGFQSLVDTFTSTDGAPTEDAVRADFDGQGIGDEVMNDLTSQNDTTQGDLNDRYQTLFEDDGSIIGQAVGAVRDTVTGWMPTLPGGGTCTPLTFEFNGHVMTIDCRVFDLIKAALSWLLFFFTTYQITMMALSYRNGAEG